MTDFFLGAEGQLRPADAVGALIVIDCGPNQRYLMQLRDQVRGIFYPGHWGIFGGAMEGGETSEEALRRELKEELNLEPQSVSYFTEFVFDLDFNGLGKIKRQYFEVLISSKIIQDLVL